MDWLVLTPLLLTTAIAAYLAWSGMRQARAPEQVTFVAMMGALFIWAGSYLVRLILPSLEAKIFWTQVSFIGIALVPALWIILILQFTGQKQLVTRPLLVFLSLEPLLMGAMVATNNLHHEYWRSIQLALPHSRFSSLQVIHGPLFFVHSVYSYCLLALGLAIFLLMFQRLSGLYRRQALALLVAALLPIFGNLVYILDIAGSPRLDLTPLLMGLASPMLAWSLFQFKLGNVAAVAYASVLENLLDGVIVLDIQNRIAAINAAALKGLGKDRKEVVGQPAEAVFAPWSDLVERLRGQRSARTEVTLNLKGVKRYFDLWISPLYDKQQRLTGTIIVIHNVTHHKQMGEALQRRASELAALHETLLAITQPHDLPVLLQTIVERATHLVNAEGGSLFLRQDGQTCLKAVVSYNSPSDITGTILSFGEGAAGSVLATGTPLIIDDYQEWPARVVRATENRPIHALLSVPMRWQEEIIGVINVLDMRPERRFTRSDLDLISMFANQAAIAVENARLLQAERHQRAQAETLREITGLLSATLDREQVLSLILEQLERVVAFDSTSLMLVDQGHLHIVAHRHLQSSEQLTIDLLVNDLGHVQTVIEPRQPLIIPNTLVDPRWKVVEHSDYIHSWLGVPLNGSGGTVIGVLNLDKQTEDFYTQQDSEVAMAFANQAALAIENARLFETVQRRAQEADTLRQATAVVISTLNLEEALSRILIQLERVVPYDSAAVQLLRDGQLEMVGGRGWNCPTGLLTRFESLPPEHPHRRVLQERKPVILAVDPEADSLFSHQPAFENNLPTPVLSWMGVPLIVYGQVIGMLGLGSRHPDFYTKHHARLVVAFADQVAIAIENARLYSSERRQVEELNALRETFADITGEIDLPQLLYLLVQRATHMLGATGGELGLYDETRNLLHIVASYNMGKDFSSTEIALGEGGMGQAALTREAVIIQDYLNWEGQSPQYQGSPWHGLLAVPFLVGPRLVGAVSIVEADPERRFTQADQRLLSLFAQQAAIAVENTRLYQEARQAAERRAVLHTASKEIVAVSLDPEGIYTAIHRAASQVMKTEAFVISIRNDARQVIEAVYMVDKNGREPAATIPLDRGISGRVIATGEPMYIEDMLLELDRIDSIHFGSQEEVRSILAVPMRLRGQVIGMLSAQSYQPFMYTDEDQHLLDMLASYAAIALDNARLFQEVQNLAITDALTDIFNRRQLFNLGQRELSRARRFGRPLALIMIDLDHFKQVNDTYGHPAGDHVLHSVAQLFQANIREIDILGRYGGEEFVIFLPETSLSAALAIAERLRVELEGMPLAYKDHRIHVTCSAGVTTLKPHLRDVEALIADADIALYQAKHAGRNRTATRE